MRISTVWESELDSTHMQRDLVPESGPIRLQCDRKPVDGNRIGDKQNKKYRGKENKTYEPERVARKVNSVLVKHTWCSVKMHRSSHRPVGRCVVGDHNV